MATSRIDRSDDTAATLKIIATVNGTEDAVTKEWQACTLADSTDPVNNKLAISVGGAASIAGTVTANLSATDNAVLDAIAASLVDVETNTNSGAVVGGGTEATALRVTIATDSTGVLSVDDNGGALTVDGTVTANLSATDNAVLDAIEVDTTTIAGAVSGTEMQVDVLTVPAPLSTTGGGTEATALRVTVASDSTGVLSVDDNGASLTVDGNVGTLPVTTGGCLMYHKVSAANDNAANIKASAGQVYGVTIYNNAAYPVYAKLHNTAGTPTAGTGVVRAFGCQAGTQMAYSQPTGMTFATGIGITIVKDIADAGTTAVAASDCVVGIEHK